MVYILSTNLKDQKKLMRELKSIRGIQRVAPLQIFSKLGFNPKMKAGSLTNLQVNRLLDQIYQNYYVGSELNQLLLKDIKRLVKIGTYRGIRHVRKLPVRGQRTHTNANTVSRVKKG